MTQVGGELWIDNNDMLHDLSPLQNIQSIGENLVSGGNLNILNNETLQSLSGLENIAPASIMDLNIHDNPALSECAINSICDYLLNPAGMLDIHDNASGCNSQEEIELACLTAKEEVIFTDAYTISPNPIRSISWIEYTLKKKSMVSLKVYSLDGKELTTLINELQEQGKQKVLFDGKYLKPGVYTCVLKSHNPKSSEKTIKFIKYN